MREDLSGANDRRESGITNSNMKCADIEELSTFLTASGDVRLLTVKSTTDKLSKISQIHKHLMKISNTYLITRENNKKTAGFHYHAVLKVQKEPSKSWFKKGIHMNLLKIGRYNGEIEGLNPPLSLEPSIKQLVREAEDGETTIDEVTSEVMKRTAERSMKNQERIKHIKRALDYILKELTCPEQYVNYQFVIKGKSTAIRARPPAPGGIAGPPFPAVEGEGAEGVRLCTVT